MLGYACRARDWAADVQVCISRFFCSLSPSVSRSGACAMPCCLSSTCAAGLTVNFSASVTTSFVARSVMNSVAHCTVRSTACSEEGLTAHCLASVAGSSTARSLGCAMPCCTAATSAGPKSGLNAHFSTWSLLHSLLVSLPVPRLAALPDPLPVSLTFPLAASSHTRSHRLLHRSEASS